MRRLRTAYGPRARDDLIEISRFLQRMGASRRTAHAYVQRIRAHCRSIGDVPGMGRARDDLAPGLRMTGFERRASIVFRVEAERVLIVNIFYGGRDIDNWFRERGAPPEQA